MSFTSPTKSTGARAIAGGAIAIAICLLCGGQAAAQSPGSSPALIINISNIESDAGTIRLQVLNSEAGFNGSEEAVAAVVVPASAEGVSISLNPLPEGEYAIRVMHDKDGDGELASNAVGMPTEPWGISNNALGQFGPPAWSDARFSIPAAAPQNIELR